MLDVGLLCCMVRLRQDVLLDGNELFTEFKGALTEQYVLQQLKTKKNVDTYYWANDRGTAEVDFLIDDGISVIPLEVKAELNLRAKSLKTFREKYAPSISIRTSMADYEKQDGLYNLPLYAIDTIGREREQ
jgi:predicted AAA+ superfamily ATPase